jgi:hypothetical protein
MQIVARHSARAMVATNGILIWRFDQAIDGPILDPVPQRQGAAAVANTVTGLEMQLMSNGGGNIFNAMTVDENGHGASPSLPSPEAVPPSAPRDCKAKA